MKNLIITVLVTVIISCASTNSQKSNAPPYPPDLPDSLKLAYEEPPIVIKKIAPEYPEFARKHGVQGEVLLQVEILADGSVGVIQIKKSLLAGPGGLDEAAINAVKQWIFNPAKSDGKPVNSWATFPIRFNLN